MVSICIWFGVLFMYLSTYKVICLNRVQLASNFVSDLVKQKVRGFSSLSSVIISFLTSSYFSTAECVEEESNGSS